MLMSVEKICEEANKLSVAELGDLISRLIQELGQPEHHVSPRRQDRQEAPFSF